MINAKELKYTLRGRWEPVLWTLAPEVGPAIERAPRHVPCPVHGGKDGFRLFKNWQEDGGGICNTCGIFPDGFELIKWLRGWSFKQVLTRVNEVINGKVIPIMRRRPAPAAIKPDDDKLVAKLAHLWQEAVPLSEPEAAPARKYLANRGIEVFDVPSLRLHPDLPYFEEGKEHGRYPALLGLFLSPEKQGITLHRIYLTKDGRKAPVESAKKTMPIPYGQTLSGAAIRLGPAGSSLGMAEGVETALAVMTATGQVCWATTTAVLLQQVVLPPQVQRITIWADNDESNTGLKSAFGLAERLVKEGRKAEIKIPKRPLGHRTWDWADVLMETLLISASA